MSSKRRTASAAVCRCALLIAAMQCSGIACSSARLDRVAATVVDRESGTPLPNAAVVVRYQGKTWAREQWWHAATSLKSSRCVLKITKTDGNGQFSIEPFTIDGHFGDPQVLIKLYRDGYRHEVDGEHFPLAQSGQLRLAMWPEAAAEKYESWSGEPVDLSKVAPVNLDNYFARLRNRHDFLDSWLAGGLVADSCEYEPDEEQHHQLLLARFQEWLESAPATPYKHELAACGKLGSLRESDAGTKFIASHRAELQRLCPRTNLN